MMVTASERGPLAPTPHTNRAITSNCQLVDTAAAEALIPILPPEPAAGSGGHARDAVLALAPAANWRAKTWRAERFAALAQAIGIDDCLARR